MNKTKIALVTLKLLPESKASATRELLSDMTKRGLLMQLKEGVYYIIPFGMFWCQSCCIISQGFRKK